MFYTNKNKRSTNGQAYFGEFSLDEEREVNELVKLFRGMGFTRSAQISLYIRQNKLGFNPTFHVRGKKAGISLELSPRSSLHRRFFRDA